MEKVKQVLAQISEPQKKVIEKDESLSDDENLLIARILEVTQSPESRNFYVKAIRLIGSGAVEVELAETKYAINSGRAEHPAKYFNALLKKQILSCGNMPASTKNITTIPQSKIIGGNLPIWAEENTIQFPFCLLSKRETKKEYELNYKSSDGNEHQWKIVAKDEKLPGPGARKVLRALELLLGYNGNKESRRVNFSLYMLKKLTHLSLQTIVCELERLVNTAIFCNGTLFDKRTGQFAVMAKGAMGIFEKVFIKGHIENDKRKGEEIKEYEKGYVVFSSWYASNYLNKYVHRLPSWILKVSPQSSRLWELLSVRRPNEEMCVKVDYDWLCDRMPMRKELFKSKIIEQMTGIFYDLFQLGVVTCWKFCFDYKQVSVEVQIERRERGIETRENNHKRRKEDQVT